MENSLPPSFSVTKRWDMHSSECKMTSDVLARMEQFSKKHGKKFSEKTTNTSLSTFLNRIRYIYVPAIKDEQVFKETLNLLQESLFSSKNKKILDTPINEANHAVQNVIGELQKDFEDATGIKNFVELPNTLNYTHGLLQVNTQTSNGLISIDKTLVDDMVRKVQELNKDNFAVRQHLKYVELYANADNYAALTYEDTLLMGQELAPLITPEEDDPKALRFDALMYGIELAYLAGKKYGKARSDLMKKVAAVASVANIPEIMAQSDLLNKILHTDYLETAGINEFEHIRKNLRDLIKYIPVVQIHYDTILDDEILSEDWNESELENDDLKNYKAKAEFYVRQHTDNVVIAKLKGNIPLNSEDVKALEEILWNEIGTKQDYEAEYGQKPLGEFVREIVGLEMNAAKEAFAQYLNDTSLDSRQIYFVNQIVEYIVHNGMMKDLSVLQEAPFTDHGSIVEVFTDLSVWAGIRKAIERVNANAVAA